MRLYIGIDNGTTGSIGILSDDHSIEEFYLTPKKIEQSYTKKKKNISRIDHDKLYKCLLSFDLSNAIAIVERPLVNPGLFTATISAVRALESTMCVLERLGISIQFEDSKKWQKMLLPIDVKGIAELKKASRDIACRLFPNHSDLINKHKDGDGILLAEFARRKNF